MALSSTLYSAQLQIADQDRQHYQSYSLKVALHPSELEQRLVARLLAWSLFADPDLKFGKGLSSSDEPDIWLHHAHGDIAHWIEIGEADASRLKKASRMADQVTLLVHTPSQAIWWQKQATAIRVLDNVRVLAIAPDALAALSEDLPRQIRWQVTISEGTLYVSHDDRMFEVPVSALQPIHFPSA